MLRTLLGAVATLMFLAFALAPSGMAASVVPSRASDCFGKYDTTTGACAGVFSADDFTCIGFYSPSPNFCIGVCLQPPDGHCPQIFAKV